MLGYSNKDIEQVKNYLSHAANYAKDAGDKEVAQGCMKALDILDGLVIEGYFDIDEDDDEA